MADYNTVQQGAGQAGSNARRPGTPAAAAPAAAGRFTKYDAPTRSTFSANSQAELDSLIGLNTGAGSPVHVGGAPAAAAAPLPAGGGSGGGDITGGAMSGLEQAHGAAGGGDAVNLPMPGSLRPLGNRIYPQSLQALTGKAY